MKLKPVERKISSDKSSSNKSHIHYGLGLLLSANLFYNIQYNMDHVIGLRWSQSFEINLLHVISYVL